MNPLLPLNALALAGQGRDRYYRALSASVDEILRVGAWGALIDTGAIGDADHETILELAKFGAIRRRAFAHYRKQTDRPRALSVAQTDLGDRRDIEQLAMIAIERGEPAAIRDAHIPRFLLDGDLNSVRHAADAANAAGGWREAVAWHARVVALNPTDFDAAASLANLLNDANQHELLAQYLTLIGQVPRLRPVADLFRASAALAAGDAAGCLASLEALEERGRTSEFKFTLGALGARLKGRALEKLKRFPDAFRAYSAMNQADAPAFPKPAPYIDRVKAANALEVSPRPASERRDCVMMLGFPRSGTTLLENALAAHHKIETLEEVPSVETAIAHLEQRGAGRGDAATESHEARRRYFDEIDHRVRKPGATVFIDKMPIRSLYAPFLKSLFPDQRYIFSIRHPYDVALSCFKQRFRPNGAMSSFLTFADTIRLYDFTMTTWFASHTLEDEHVHYVRYNQLVTDFETRLRKTLGFLGLDWDPAVLDFAAQAQQRGTKTPSYQKVRQGLSIGVQTYWKDYQFLFKPKESAPLTKWARFFGYETV